MNDNSCTGTITFAYIIFYKFPLFIARSIQHATTSKNVLSFKKAQLVYNFLHEQSCLFVYVSSIILSFLIITSFFYKKCFPLVPDLFSFPLLVVALPCVYLCDAHHIIWYHDPTIVTFIQENIFDSQLNAYGRHWDTCLPPPIE